MPDSNVTDINTLTTDGNNTTSVYARSLTVASDGTAVATGTTAVIPDYDPARDTLLIAVSTPATVTISVNSANPRGRTNDMAFSATSANLYVIPPGKLPLHVFRQAVGSLRLTTSAGTLYTTVLR